MATNKKKKATKAVAPKKEKVQKLFGNYSLKLYTKEEVEVIEYAQKITNEKTVTRAVMQCARLLPKRMNELNTFVLQNQQLQFELDDLKEAISNIINGLDTLRKYNDGTEVVTEKEKNNGKKSFKFR